MTQDEIIRMAQEAGFEVVNGKLRLYLAGENVLLQPNCVGTITDGLKQFATLVAAREREACAKVCDEYADYDNGCEYSAAAIRARKF